MEEKTFTLVQGTIKNGTPLQPLLLNIPQVAKMLSLSRTKFYELIAYEGLPILRFGRAVRVSPTSLQQWLACREAGTHHPLDAALR
jgi:excisionase family DNA binding protein